MTSHAISSRRGQSSLVGIGIVREARMHKPHHARLGRGESPKALNRPKLPAALIKTQNRTNILAFYGLEIGGHKPENLGP